MRCYFTFSLLIACLITAQGQQSLIYLPFVLQKQQNQNTLLIPITDESLSQNQLNFSNQAVKTNNLPEIKKQASSKNENVFETVGIRIFPLRTSDFVNVLLQESTEASLTGEFVLPDGSIGKSVLLEALFNEINLTEMEPGNYRFRIITADGKQVAETLITREESIIP